MKAIFKLAIVVIFFSLSACSKDKDETPNANQVNHQGEKWNIKSADYTIIDQNLTNISQGVKTGSKEDAGTFYFNGSQGSFDIYLDTYHKEDVFSVSENTSSVSLTGIVQNVGTGTISQNVISLSGDLLSDGSLELSGTITKQSQTGQFILTANFILEKE